MHFSIVEFATSIISFLLIWFVLGNFVFKPFFALLEDREKRTEGNESRAKETKVATQNILLEIEDRLRDIRVQVSKHRDEKIQSVKKEAQTIIDLANQKAEKEMKSGQLVLSEKRTQAINQLPAEVETVSDLIVKKTLNFRTNVTIH